MELIGQLTAGRLEISLNDMVSIYTENVLFADSVLENQLGLYSYAISDRAGNMRTVGLRGPEFVLGPRTRDFRPKGRFEMTAQNSEVMNAALQMRLMPNDFAFGEFQRILQPEQENDFLASQEGQQLFGKMLEFIYTAMRSNCHELATWGGHEDVPFIDEETYTSAGAINPNILAALNGSMEDKERSAAWHDMLRSDFDPGNFKRLGWMGKLDKYVSGGGSGTKRPTYFDLDVTDFKLENQRLTYVGGDIYSLLDKALNVAPRKLFQSTLQTENNSVLMVDSSIFDALISQYINDGSDYEFLKIRIEGENTERTLTRTSTRYKGTIIVRCQEFDKFNHDSGVFRARIVYTVLGNVEISSKLSPVESRLLRGDAGLVVYQSPDVEDNGRISIKALPNVGAQFIAPDMVVYARSPKITV